MGERIGQDAAGTDGPPGGAWERAVTLHRLGRPADAISLYDDHLRANPDDATALFLAGTARLQLRDLSAAEGLLVRAAALEPDAEEIHSNLGLVLDAMGRHEEAIVALRRALSLRPDFAAAHNNLGEVLKQVGRRGESIEAFRQAVLLDPGLAAAQSNLGMALGEEGDAAAAEAAFRAALRADPLFDDAHSNLCSLLLQRRQYQAALAATEAYLRCYPGHAGALAFRYAAFLQGGQKKEAESLVAFDSLFHAETVQPPAGFVDGAAFNAAVVGGVLAHPSLIHRHAGVSVRLGRHSAHLTDSASRPLALALDAIVRRAVHGYVNAVALPPNHAFRCAPDIAISHVNIWAVVMDRGGHELPHIHPKAWLSGVYYAQVPDSTARSDGRRSGWIGFGRLPDMYPLAVTPALRWVRPEEGLLILFPSYFFHETVPLADDDVRVSIAFDIFLKDAGDGKHAVP